MGKGTRETVNVDTLTGDGAPIIAAAAMTAVGRARLGGPSRPQNATAKYLETCQIAALEACYAAGVTDPVAQRAAKLKAKRIGEESLRLAVEKLNREAAEQIEKEAKEAAADKAKAPTPPPE